MLAVTWSNLVRCLTLVRVWEMALGASPASSGVLPGSPVLLPVASRTFPVSSTVFPRPSCTLSFSTDVRTSMSDPTELIVAPPVAGGIRGTAAVVALETTPVTHGFPYPEGPRVAAELEPAVAAEDAPPATIGIVDGRVRLSIDQAGVSGHLRPRSIPARVNRDVNPERPRALGKTRGTCKSGMCKRRAAQAGTPSA
jgi:hypothetical protein